MEELRINGKAIYTPKGAAMEYGRIGCNFYTGCPHECSYCYLKRGAPSKQLGGNVARLKKCFKDEADALEKLKKDVERYKDVLQKTGVFFSFTTDPLIPETRELTYHAAEILMKNGIPVTLLTKCADWVDTDFGRRMIELNSMYYGLSVGFTLTGRDDMEPNASSNHDRICAMRRLKDAFVKTWASIEPVIDWLSCITMIGQTLDCCEHYKIGLRSGVGKDYYDIDESGLYLDTIITMCLLAYRTVYLKISARKLLQRCYADENYNKILSRTVDMDGNFWQPTNI